MAERPRYSLMRRFRRVEPGIAMVSLCLAIRQGQVCVLPDLADARGGAEQKNDEAFARALASSVDAYVFDAFSVTAVDEAGTADFDRAEATGSPLTLTPRVPPAYSEKALPIDLSVVDWRN